LDGPGPNCKIVGSERLRARSNANAEAANGGGIPQSSLRLGKASDEATERPYSGIRSPGHPGDFKERSISPPNPPHVEHHHSSAKALYKRLEVVLRVDVQINVQKLRGGQMTSLETKRSAENLFVPPCEAPRPKKPPKHFLTFMVYLSPFCFIM
jgi:hypothetical protein